MRPFFGAWPLCAQRVSSGLIATRGAPACSSLVPVAVGGPAPTASVIQLRWLGTANYDLALVPHSSVLRSEGRSALRTRRSDARHFCPLPLRWRSARPHFSLTLEHLQTLRRHF